MTLTFTVDPVVDPALRDGVTELWTEVSNAGGAVGFVPPVTAEDIRPELVKHLVAMAEGATGWSSAVMRTGGYWPPPSSRSTRTGCRRTGSGPTPSWSAPASRGRAPAGR